MPKISYTGFFGLSLAISAQFIFKMCVPVCNRKNLWEPLILKVQCRSRSSR